MPPSTDPSGRRNPLSVDRYRDRHRTSRAKSDPGDAKVLTDLVRTDRVNHRPVAGDSDLAEDVKLLARTHQSFVWKRQRYVNRLRSAFREFYPAALQAFGTDLASADAVAILRNRAHAGARARALALEDRRGAPPRGSPAKRRGEGRADPGRTPGRTAACPREPRADLRRDHPLARRPDRGPERPDRTPRGRPARGFERHPDAEIILSLPGLGSTLGARVLGEFGDDRTRYVDARARRNDAGTSPITKASGKRRVVLARFARNARLYDACHRWAFSSLSASPGARRSYDTQRTRGTTHNQALRALANRLVGILHGCLSRGEPYREEVAWPVRDAMAA